MKEIALPLHPAPARVWIAVVALGICAFSIVTSELAPVGMFSALAADFHQTESGMGLAVTAYGWVGALAALLSGAMPARISRKALLVGLMLILALSCLAATRSYSMFALMSARMIGALAHGAFWALIGIVAAQQAYVTTLRQALCGVYFLGEQRINYEGASFGVVICDPQSIDVEAALRAADEAMYQDKKSRRQENFIHID